MTRRQAKKALRSGRARWKTLRAANRVIWRARYRNKTGPNTYVNGRWGRWDWMQPAGAWELPF